MSEAAYRQLATEAIALLSMNAPPGKEKEIEDLIKRLSDIAQPTHHTFEAASLDSRASKLETPR